MILNLAETSTITLFSLVSYPMTQDNPNYAKHQKAVQLLETRIYNRVGKFMIQL
jgi:hypothetical protein